MRALRLIGRLIWRIVTIIDKILVWISFIILGPLLFRIALDFLPKSLVIMLSIFVVFGIIYLKWHLSKKDFWDIFVEVGNCKDKEKAIEILEEALALKPFTDLEKAMALSLIGGLYEELEEPTNANYYYDEAIKSAKRNLELRTLSPSERIETLGQLALIYSNKKEYKQSSHYLDSMLQFALNERKFFIGKNELITVLEAYTYSGQKQRAIDIYYALLEKKKCKRNKTVEELLEIRFH